MRYLLIFVFIFTCGRVCAQSNNPVSVYESENINSVRFEYNSRSNEGVITAVEGKFKIYPQTPFNSFMIDYYTSQVNLMEFVEKVFCEVEPVTQGGVDIILKVTFGQKKEKKSKFSFPLIYTDARNFFNAKISASQMAYSNNNAWFAQPTPILNGNPLVDTPVGNGYTAWLEGFAMAALYGVTTIIPKYNLGIYGGASYMISYSAGRELFTDKSRFWGGVDDAFVGVVGSGRTKNGHNFIYNVLYGRKQFILGDGWILINTSMNGGNRAALQLNPRWATKELFNAGFSWDRFSVGVFRLSPNELPILNSNTVINGVNVEFGSRDNILFGASFLQVPKSKFKYYHPSGDVTTRDGLQLFNVRVYKSSKATNGGIFFKSEGGYQRNAHFTMRSYAFYGELGWLFKSVQGSPSVSYRFGYFSGDDPSTSAYERWDALYTGGNGEQWVQGSNMYKMVQNSNEASHRFQVIYKPIRKMELVGQVWLFHAPQKLNLGGNPALSMLKAKYYGTEFNLTVKYFSSRRLYLHMNTAFTMPGDAIKKNVSDTKNWFSLMAFVRYSF